MSNEKLANALAVIPVIVMITFANVLIASIVSGFVFIQLVAVVGWSKWASLGVAILIAIAVHGYIVLQPKIRNYISRRSQ
jgi:membrane protein YdbS with pleckstrin-like domain